MEPPSDPSSSMSQRHPQEVIMLGNNQSEELDGVVEELEDEIGLDGIDPEQLRQMMADPRYAALFAEHCRLNLPLN